MTIDDDRCLLAQGIPPDWASSWGEDEFGLFVGVTFGEAEQRLRWIPGGTFMMGSANTEEGRWEREGPEHEVTLTEGFWLADTPCTQTMWIAVMGDYLASAIAGSLYLPMAKISWDDTQLFLRTFNAYVGGLRARLPTEAQWERACRAGSQDPAYGSRLEIAWYSENSEQRTHAVSEKLANPWGLYDMLGNVWEWCEDVWDGYVADACTDPLGAQGRGRVIRGGGWESNARHVRAACRNWQEPDFCSPELGFRLAVAGRCLRTDVQG